MKKFVHAFVLLCFFSGITFAQPTNDSIIRFSNLKYHSAFEKEAVKSFLKDSTDSFPIFLAIDENITARQVEKNQQIYLSIFSELEQKKIAKKKSHKQIKLIYSTVHNRFLKKYKDNQYFPSIFETGNYNCVSASMLYAMIFDSLDIPYKVNASANHVYLVANPGPNSMVIETTNPGFEKAIFTGAFKQQYVSCLRTSKLISDEEYKDKSTEEIFEEKFKEVKIAKFRNFPGFQYYNKALSKLQENDIENALVLAQKAYFFYPDNQVKTLLFNALLFQIEKCDFDKINDIDYLGQYSRFENSDWNAVAIVFNNVVSHHLKYANKEDYCDSIFLRLKSQITDNKTIEEIEFSYNMQMSYHYINSPKVEKYISRAMETKGNFNDAILIMQSLLNQKLYAINDPHHLLDSVKEFKIKYPYEMIQSTFVEHESLAYIKIVRDLFDQKKATAGEKYLLEFENICIIPVKNQLLSDIIESTYRTASKHYYYKGNKTKAQDYNERGMKFLPRSTLLGSPIY